MGGIHAGTSFILDMGGVYWRHFTSTERHVFLDP